MRYLKQRPLVLGLIISIAIAVPVLSGILIYNWWTTPLGPPLGISDTSLVDQETYQVSGLTLTENPQITISPTETAAPTMTPYPTATPAPLAMCGGPDNLTILVTGVDSGSYIYGLSDAIRLVWVDFVNGKITILPLPRDLWVDIPVSIPGVTKDITPGKLNQAYFYGSPGMGYYKEDDQSPGLLAKTLNFNFNVIVDRYFSVNTRIFRQMVDQVGGIDVNLPKNVYGHHLDDPVVYLRAGEHHLNGKQAEMVARHRTLIGDFGRMKNQTVLLKAFVKKLLSPQEIKELPELIEIYQDNVLMDFSPSDISKLICLISKIDLVEDVTFVNFPKDLVTEENIYDKVHKYKAAALTYDINEIRLLLAKLRLGIWP